MGWCVQVGEEEEGWGWHMCHFRITFTVRNERVQQITQRARCCPLLGRDCGKPVAVIGILVLWALRSEVSVTIA